MKKYFSTICVKILINVFAILLIFSALELRAQEMPVNTTSEEGKKAFLQARQTHQVGWFEKADDLFRRTIDLEPDLALAHAYASVLDYLLFRDPSERISRARELADTLRGPEKRMVDALVFYAESNYDEVEAALRDVLEIYPDDPYARHRLGAVMVSADRPDEGVEILKTLVRDRPDYPGAWNHLGYGLLALGRTEEALDAFRNFLKATPENPSAHDSYATGLAEAGEVYTALGHLTRAVLHEPRFAYGWLHMGELLRKEGALLEAKSAYEQAKRVSQLYGPRFVEALDRRISELTQ
jgi:tetratricopeptide (TPR) repeat protein